MIDTKLGPYEIREEIGRGGMATVYRAHQPSVDRHVAIKVIMKHIAGDTQAMQRFQREARLIARLEHPHILPVHDFDGGHEPPYIVMRYLDGGTLKEVMQQGTLPLAEISYLMRQVCSALDYAHRQGITHRDIKPSNIIIDREGNAFVTDFGLARLVAGGTGEQITETGAIMGTPEYMSPEQAAGSTDIDHRIDIYALGVVLFQMLTGQLPYVANHPMAALIMHMQEPVPSALDRNPDLPPAVDEVMMKALAKEPADRYASANELALAVIATLGGTMSRIPSRLQAATGESIMLRHKRAVGGEKAGSSESTPTPTEQQKQVTVLYANLAEFMEIVVEAVEDSHAMRQSLWQRLDEVIVEYGGTIDTHTGDTVLALWGVQSVREDDPEQAVRAALAMQQAVAAAFAEVKTSTSDVDFGFSPLDGDDDEPLPVQVGIHTGLTLLTRSQESGSYSASGPTVNMTARLEQSAPVGGILISPETYNYVRGVFLIEGLDPIRFRGRKQAVQLYLVKGVKPRTFRQTTPAVEGIDTRTIGREAELKQLIEALEMATEDEETQVVTVVSEAGLGKTRLLYELSEWEEKLEGDFFYFPTHTTPQMVHQPFALFRELFSFRFEIHDSDSLDVVQAKFEQGLAGFIGPDTTEQAHIIAHLLGFTFPDSPYLQNRDPQQLNSLAQKYLTDFFVTASRRTTISEGNLALGAWLQFENIHWADDRSLDFINHLVESQPDLRLVITCTTRPSLYERRTSWGSGQDFHQRLDLRPLSRRDSRKLVKEILQKVDHIPKELRDLIVDRAEGNPFYMEELVKMLVEDRVVLKGDEVWVVELERLAQARVPGTLTGLLQARLDSLLPEERITLQRASVVGRVFWAGTVKALHAADNLTVDVDHALAVLSSRELISIREETTFSGVPEYIFKSTMLHDVTYDSILKRQQRSYHYQVAKWLVEVSGARAGEYSSLIAEHYQIAGENVLAAEYLYRAGEQATAVSAYVEAGSFFERALALVTGQVDSETRRLQAALQYQLGGIYIDQGQWAAGDKHLQASLSLARELGDTKRSVEALANLGQSAVKQGNFAGAETYLHEALTLARETGDKANMAFALMWLGGNALFQKEFEQSETYMLEALALAREAGAQALEARTLNILGENARYQDKYVDAAAYYQEALSIYRTLDNQFGTALISSNLGHVAAALGDVKTAFSHYLRALQISIEIQAMQIVLETLAGLAGLKVAGGEAERALELLGLSLHHPASNPEVQQVADSILTKLRAELPVDVVEAGLKKGRSLDFDTVIQELLVEAPPRQNQG
jgi:predicted ATPase/class 3 adenylate cyclase/tRNA A-37 threonylcarbamoyl transferase component Bud32